MNIYDFTRLKEVARAGESRILTDEANGLVVFRHGDTGMAFNYHVGAWSSPLRFREPGEPSMKELIEGALAGEWVCTNHAVPITYTDGTERCYCGNVK